MKTAITTEEKKTHPSTASRCRGILAAVMMLGVAAGCGGGGNSTYPSDANAEGRNNPAQDPDATYEGLFGTHGGSTAARDSGGGPAEGVGVNGYLWRASLDTLSFMPLASADPFGGVIITEWHADPRAPNERFKITAYILDRRLRADGIRIAVFRQLREDAEWTDVDVAPETAVKLENAILDRARQLRIDATSSAG